MINDFYDNLTTITNNLEDIAFTKYATITNINSDGTCTAKEDEEEGLTHENVLTLSHNLQVGDKVVIGFVDNSIYNPVILGSMNETFGDSYTKAELDGFVNCLIERLDNADEGGGDVVGFDVDIDMRFTGVSGRDDSITLSANLIYVEE
jgi:hypothetical protein